MVINEAKKFIDEGDKSTPENINTEKSKRKITFDKVESLINEMDNMNCSISKIELDNISPENGIQIMEEEKSEISEKRSMNIDEHNKKKDFKHTNEGEKDKWKRMLDYQIPKDEER